MRSDISNVLHELCIPAHLLGHKYIVSALDICMDYPEAVRRMGLLYETLAEAHVTTDSCVERNIRHAITCAYNNMPPERAAHIINPYLYADKPSNSVFLSAVAEWLRQNQKEKPPSDSNHKSGNKKIYSPLV